ncbi:hypothetical protein B0H17DRAFT_1174445 [Mycena rosella]|uniref:Extracellular serine-rich protein n=1 Tax=Mycena rosella TaxID=1033263 RepID=A0AAD7GXG4_MYCRO|nr:hypothetical protein B0H17DRAFT_1174445 [Mycena rosella]
MLLKAILLTLIPVIVAVDHPVTVGLNGGLTFTPDAVLADIGDTLTFAFVSKNHSVTTTNFSGAVCPPPAGGIGVNGWDSGFLSALGTVMPQFVYTVVDTEPHFASCMQAAGAHCRAGMNFALNPTAAMTFAQFNANAMAS